MKRFKGLTIAVGICLAGMLAMPAHAALGTLTVQLNGTNGAGTISGGTICVDNDPLCDQNPTLDILTWNNVADGLTFTIQGTTATSGSPTGFLTISANGTPSSTGSFNLAVSDTGYNNPTPPLTIFETVSGNAAPLVAGGSAANITAVGYFSPTNTLFGTGGTATGAANATTTSAPATAQSPLIASGNPYALTQLITVAVTTVGTGLDKNIQFTGNLTAVAAAVPEPASVAMLGGALLLSFGMLRRKARRA